MSDESHDALDAFLRGERTLAEVERAFTAGVAADPAAAPRLRAEVDRLYRHGRLPLQVQRMLLRKLAAADATARPAGYSAPGADATVMPGAPRADAAVRPNGPDSGAAPRPSAAEPDAAHAASGDVAGAAAGSAANAASTGADWAHPERWNADGEEPVGPGSVIKDRFVIESVIGHGGMGVVFRALDRRKLEARDRDPYVAIKILNAELRKHPDALIALQREARKAQLLAHPNISVVHDFDRDGATVYLTMELLDGETLDRVIAAHAPNGLPRDAALALVRGMSAALAYAHEQGIVHSDFKPGNVIRTRRGHVKLLDFGIARAVPTRLHRQADDTAFDATTLGALTPSYASAEMLAGEPPVPADDVFALGIVAYELLTGRHPFDKLPAAEARAKGLKPAAIPSLPRRQRRALADALSLDRAGRPPDAGAFLARFDGPSARRAAGYAAVLAALAGVAAYGLYVSVQIKPDFPFESLPPEAQRQFDDAVAEGERGLALGDFALNEAFDYFSLAYAIHRNNPRAIAGLEKVADRFLSNVSGADPALQEDIVRKLYCHEHLRGYDRVRAACDDTFGAARCAPDAMRCTGRE